MRRFVKGLLVVSLATALTTTSAFAAPRRDDGDFWIPLKKIVQIIKKLVKAPTDDMTFPKP